MRSSSRHRSSNKGKVYRDRNEIFYDILRVVKSLDKCSIRNVMYTCGLSPKSNKQYASFLISCKLLEMIQSQKKEGYDIILAITDKGLRYIELFEHLRWLIRSRDNISRPSVYVDYEDVAERHSKFRHWRKSF